MPVVALAVAGLATQGLPAQELPEWVLQLSRVKRQARANFERLPNYACQEVIRRYHRAPNRPGGSSWNPLSTLQFEVAFIGGRELFAKPGSDYFDASQVLTYVNEGAINTGTFSSMVRNLFVYDNARTTGWGKDKLNGRAAIWYDFEIPERLAGYQLITEFGSGNAGVRGRFWVDAETLDLLRIDESATDIPGQLGLAEAGELIDYARMRIGRSDVVLPRVAEMWMAEMGGRQLRNVIEFSGCREYGSESLIHFEEPAASPLPPAKKK